MGLGRATMTRRRSSLAGRRPTATTPSSSRSSKRYVQFSLPSFAGLTFREQGFACEPVLQTCMVYLEGYKTFTDPEQMKRIVSLMHRQAIKAKTEALFFKVRFLSHAAPQSLLMSWQPTVLELFQRILDDEAFVASKDSAPSDLKKLIEYILRKFFKVVKERPMRLLEVRLRRLLLSSG